VTGTDLIERPRAPVVAPWLLVELPPLSGRSGEGLPPRAGTSGLGPAHVPDESPRAASASRDTGSDALRLDQADVLVVEDDEGLRTSMAKLLRSYGFSVVEAFDGQSALDVLAATSVAIMLVDLHMSPRDGIWLLERLEHPPVVFVLSAFALYDEVQVRSQFSELVSGFLRKPVPPAALIEVVHRALDQPSGH